MKRLLILLILLALLALVMPVAGLSLTFQDSSEFGAYVICSTGGTGTCTYSQSSTGKNSYIRTFGSLDNTNFGYFYNTDPSPTTYAAVTLMEGSSSSGSAYNRVVLKDSTFTTTHDITLPQIAYPQRIEVIVASGAAKIYIDDKFYYTTGAIAQNPSYIGFGSKGGAGGTARGYWDDLVYGTTENREIVGSPEQGYYLKKDLTNPANNGFYSSNGTLVNNNNITTTWGVGDTNTSRNIIFKEWSGASNAWNYSTTVGTMAGSIAWPLQEAIFNNPSAPYGYYITTVQGSGVYSSVVPYIAGGGFVNFDSEAYGTGDTATMTWTVDAGSWDTVTYNYELRLQNALYGTVMDTWSVTSSTDSETYLWSDSDELGVYYATLWRINKATSAEEMMNGDTAELTGYVRFTGYTHDGEAEATLSGVNISIVQGSTVDNILSGFNGNYSSSATTAFGTGSILRLNVTKTGYRQYQWTFTPETAKTIALNFTLVPTTPTCSGVCLGGVVRDSAYGRPLDNVTVTAVNVTHSTSQSVTGNSVGYYIFQDTSGGPLVHGYCYNMSGSRTGYSHNHPLGVTCV